MIQKLFREGNFQGSRYCAHFSPKKPILLLDDATSSLEPRLEEAVLAAIMSNQRKSGGTVIAVMHRLDYVERFDQLMVVLDGKIKAFGNPREVLASNGPDTWT